MATRHRSVGLGKRLKEAGQLLRGQSDARVRHVEAHSDHRWVAPFREDGPRGLTRDPQRDAARVGELHRVGQEVDQDLPESKRIGPDDQGNVALDLRAQRQPSLQRGRPKHRRGFVNQRTGVDGDALDGHPAGLDPGVVEEVIDDPEHVPPVSFDRPQRVLAAHGIVGISPEQFAVAEDRG